ncbi:MAG: hypothetical protein IPK83_12150 [Planctomycetes bacterium]|nr:hypothetical protein [Planctomycetota bacterium]
MPRASVVWAKFNFAMMVTAGTALPVTMLSISSLKLPPTLAMIQLTCTFATCAGLCGLAIGLGAKLPSFDESSTARISSGLGGTVNLIASVGLVAASVALFGYMCWQMAIEERLTLVSQSTLLALGGILLMNFLAFVVSMTIGVRSFERQEF